VKLYIKIGNYIFDYIVLSLILFALGFLVVPIYIGFVMVVAYFYNDTFKYMFKVVKENIKLLVILTLISLFLGLMIWLVLQINDTGILGIFNNFVLVVLALSLMTLLFYPPMILIQMRVNFKELIQNTLYLSLRYIKETLFMVLLTSIVIYMSIYAIWGLLLVVPWIQSISYISNQVLLKEKEKRRNT
jgi:hypothetical protein